MTGTSFFQRTIFFLNLKISSKKHDLIVLRVFDKRETELPDVGLVNMKDAETGKQIWVDSSSKMVRKHYSDYWQRRTREIVEILQKHGVDSVDIATHEDYVKPLMQLFKKRA